MPIPISHVLSLLSPLFSFRSLVVLLLLLNLKNIPLAWEIRLVYRGWQQWKSKKQVAQTLREASTSATSDQGNSDILDDHALSSRPAASSHPLFASLTISLHTPLLEIDHNLHKSNSTYFSDLDESRTALMVHLLSSTRFSPAELEAEGYKGRFSIILGSVHTSFLKEISAYEPYQIRSRVLGWDEKWIVIVSFFVRKATKADRMHADKDRRRRQKLEESAGSDKERIRIETTPNSSNLDETLLAVSLSKYVVKKGRFTVPPERCWRTAGWLPDKSEGPDTSHALSEPIPDPVDSEAGTPVTSQAAATVEITEEMLSNGTPKSGAQPLDKAVAMQERIRRSNAECRPYANKWRWEDIEQERQHGLRTAKGWLALDQSLKDLWQMKDTK